MNGTKITSDKHAFVASLAFIGAIPILSIVLQLMIFITGGRMRVAASQYANVLLPLVYCDGNPLGSEVVLLLTELVTLFSVSGKKSFFPEFLEKKLFFHKH